MSCPCEAAEVVNDLPVLATFDIQQETYEFTSSITWSFDP